MKKLFIAFLLIGFPIFVFSQTDSLQTWKPKKKYVIGFIPSLASRIYGIAIGPIGSEAVCNTPYSQISNGINIQIPGQGFFQIFYLKIIPKSYYGDKNFDLTTLDTLPFRVLHNGLLISLLGTFTYNINGLCISPFMSMGTKMNGLTCNLFWNAYRKQYGISIGLFNSSMQSKGLQIGLMNRTIKLKGIQIGLWNRSSKRTFPIINWN